MYANSPQNTIENFYFCNINMWRHENDTFLGIFRVFSEILSGSIKFFLINY